METLQTFKMARRSLYSIYPPQKKIRKESLPCPSSSIKLLRLYTEVGVYCTRYIYLFFLLVLCTHIYVILRRESKGKKKK